MPQTPKQLGYQMPAEWEWIKTLNVSLAIDLNKCRYINP